MYKIKNVIALSLLTALLFGCGGEEDGSSNSIISNPVLIEDTLTETPTVESPDLPPTIEMPAIPLEPVVTKTQPQPPTLPIFIGEGITTHPQQPYSGTIVKGGDAYLRYNQSATTMDKFELPEWTVEYKYQPFLEVLITNGGETLCSRYSWKLKGFGYAKPNCLWSDTRSAIPLEDMQAAYYGYSVVESRVCVSGVVCLIVAIE